MMRHAGLIRFLDVAFSLCGLIALSPIFLSLIVVCFVDTRSPFFIQKRKGFRGADFSLYKFRTMPVDTPSMPTHLLVDAQYTCTGRLLRSTKLDELPQLVNVLRGDMSMVGPRPGLCDHDELTRRRSELSIFEMRPGITGKAQVLGIDMSDPERLAAIDRKLMEEMSVYSYFKYILVTVFGKLCGRSL